MNEPIEPQVIMKDGKPAFAVIPWEDYQELVRNYSPDESDVWFPQDVVEANVVRGQSLVRAWREHFGLTQKELAQKAGMSQPALARIEKADARPRLATLKKIADALGLTPQQLMD